MPNKMISSCLAAQAYSIVHAMLTHERFSFIHDFIDYNQIRMHAQDSWKTLFHMLTEVFYISIDATCALHHLLLHFHDIIGDHVDDSVVKSVVALGYFLGGHGFLIQICL